MSLITEVLLLSEELATDHPRRFHCISPKRIFKFCSCITFSTLYFCETRFESETVNTFVLIIVLRKVGHGNETQFLPTSIQPPFSALIPFSETQYVREINQDNYI
jgi:hypothetical protein